MPQTEDNGIVQFTVKELFLELRGDLKDLLHEVNELEKRGSDNAREALEKIKELEQKIISLEITSATNEAVSVTIKNIKVLSLGVFISIAGMIVDIVINFFKH